MADLFTTTAPTLAPPTSVLPPPATTPPPLSPSILSAFEQLNKWQHVPNAPPRFTFKHNLQRASSTRFPSVLDIARKTYGLSDHEAAAVFEWTTGDYRLVNPIARGGSNKKQDSYVEFQDYPFLPQQTTKVTCRLERDEVMPYVHVLQSALLRLPATSAVDTVPFYRGHRRPITSTRPGTTLVLPGFTSVSRDREQALSFAEKVNEGRSAQRSLLVFLESRRARSLASLSVRRDEAEYLFPLDTTCVIVEPPEDRREQDQHAAREATERLRKEMDNDDAEIQVVYLKEVVTGDWA